MDIVIFKGLLTTLVLKKTVGFITKLISNQAGLLAAPPD